MKNTNVWTVSKTITLSAVTVLGIISIMGTELGSGSGSGSGTPPPAGQQGSFLLEYNNTFDQPGDDVGGAKTPVDVPIVWTGSRQLGAEEGQTAGDTFTINATWHGFATDPWYTTAIAPNLNPGNWNLSVTVNGQSMSCASPIALAASAQGNVAFQISKEDGTFTGCTHN